MRTQVNARNRPEARENESDQVAIGFSFESCWLRGWREVSRRIAERSKAKPRQSRITFDTQSKIARKYDKTPGKQICFCFFSADDFTLEKIIELGLDQFAEQISEVSAAASKELSIEQVRMCSVFCL